MQNQSTQENFESSPRSMTIEQINNNYQRSKEQIEQFSTLNTFDKQIIRNEKYQKNLEQYTENYQIKIQKLQTNLDDLDKEIQIEVGKEKRVFDIENQQSMGYLKEITEQYREIEKLESIVNNNCSSSDLVSSIQKGLSQQLLNQLNNLNQGRTESNQQKLQFQFNLEDIEQEPQNNLDYFQKLEKQVSQIEQILGIDSKNIYDVKLNTKIEKNLADLEEINLKSDDSLKRIKNLSDEIDNLQNKKIEIKFRDKDLQMIENIWENYQNYQVVQKQIVPIKQRLEMLKKIHEESDSISKTISNLNQINQDLETNVKKGKSDLENQQKEYFKQFQNIEQEVSKIEKNLKL